MFVSGSAASRPGTLGIAAWVPRLTKTWSPTSRRVPPSFNSTSSVFGATNGRDDRRLAEPGPVDSLEAEHVVGVPEHAHALAKSPPAQQPIEVEDRVGRLPLLGENDGVPAGEAAL